MREETYVELALTLVVNGVPKQEDAKHGSDDRCTRGILAVEISSLDTR